MVSNKVLGILLLLASISLILLYVIGLVIAPDTNIYGYRLGDLLVRYTILALMLIISIIIGYIGYLVFTSPVPRPVEEIIKEYKEAAR